MRGWVTAVDADAKTVRIDDDRVLPYDTLVYGLGGVADTSAVPGAEDHAYTLSSAQDAELLADRLARLGSGTVGVAGSGLTGIESAAKIAERHPELNVVLLGRQEPGAAMTPKAKAYLHAALDRLGVRVRGGVEVVKVLPDAVELAGGKSIAADAVLWTSGTRVSPLAAAAGLVAAASGAEALTAGGWGGPYNYDNDTAKFSAVVRDWEHRFGARVIAVGFSTLHLSVAAPPTSEHEALLVAAEHFAFCPDNIWQGRRPYTLAAYAERITSAHRWDFWWD